MSLIWDVISQFSLTAEYLLIETAVVVSTIVNTLLLSAIAFKGSMSVKRLIMLINTIQKFRLVDTGDSKIGKMEKRRVYKLFLYLCFILTLYISNVVAINYSSYMKFGEAMKIISFCVGYSAIVIIIFHFVFESLMIASALQTVNLDIYQLLTDVKYNYSTSRIVPRAHDKVRSLANIYTYLCNTIRININYVRIELTLIPILLWGYFVCTAYTLVMCLRKERSFIFGMVNVESHVFMVLLNFSRCVVHLLNLLLLVEPCHRINAETQTTQYYVTQIMHNLPRSAIDSPLYNELEMFFRVIVTEKPSYAPFQLFVLNRQLAFKIIVGGISYLAIVLQLKY